MKQCIVIGLFLIAISLQAQEKAVQKSKITSSSKSLLTLKTQ